MATYRNEDAGSRGWQQKGDRLSQSSKFLQHKSKQPQAADRRNCHKGFLPKFVKYLKDIDFLKEDLRFSIHSTEGTSYGVDTYFGLCKYPGREQRHRIDFKVYSSEIYAFGLIAWTGNDVLNRRLRLLAEAKGYKLDDTGLFPVARNSTGKKVARASSSLQFKTEREVFDFLGFPWLEPHERNL